jgi:predicted GNAT family N-acyltransferase
LSAECRLTVTVRPARDPAEVAAAQDLRLRVFCQEQGVSREEELDGLDDQALHVVALDESGVVATCRLRFTEPGSGARRECKLERMAVDRRLRGLGVGAKLLAAAEQEAAAHGASTITLHAQRRAESFYAGHGYLAEGETFISARIEHVLMRKPLKGGAA